MPKILELFLPKKILAPPKSKSEIIDCKIEKSPDVSKAVPDKTSVRTEVHQGESDTICEKNVEGSFHRDLYDSTKKKKTSQSPKRSSVDKDKASKVLIPNDSTTDLLNRVLNAIQRLEKEQSLLLKNVPPHEIQEKDLIPKTDDLNAKHIHKLMVICQKIII